MKEHRPYEKTSREWLEFKVDELFKKVKFLEAQGRAIPKHHATTILEIRKRFPAFNTMLDTDIEHLYQMFCEEFHVVGWTQVDLLLFTNWATSTPVSRVEAVNGF